MAYGRKSHAGGGGRAKLMGTKIANHGKGGGGFKLHSDMREAAAKGHGKAPKMARKAV
jgi:hypothetical protein